MPEPAALAAKPRFAPYEVFRDPLEGAGRDGTTAALAAPEMVYLPGGTFLMGDKQGSGDEQPVHPVSVSAFALGYTPVTWGQYLRFCEATDSHWPQWLEAGSQYHLEAGTDDYYAKCGIGREVLDLPVVGIAWEDARAYCEWLSAQTGERYALPTEVQWEYACRAGSRTRWCFGDDAAGLGDYAWFSNNAGGRLHPVGQKLANAWGLYDMHGNVWEWCRDWYSADYYARFATPVGSAVRTDDLASGAANGPHSGPYGDSQSTRSAANGAAVAASSGEQPLAEDPSGPESGSDRVIRGGAWDDDADLCRSACRDWIEPSYRGSDLSFRLSRTV